MSAAISAFLGTVGQSLQHNVGSVLPELEEGQSPTSIWNDAWLVAGVQTALACCRPHFG